jgi:pantothenate kinase-related protein Tda10
LCVLEFYISFFNQEMYFFISILFLFGMNQTNALAGGLKQRLSFNAPALRATKDRPKLVIISGCPGTGKSTFGMSLALEQGILKCISTDTVRAVMRSYVPESISPPLHR